MKLKMLVVTNNLNNQLISRTNYLIRFLIEKQIDVKVLDFSFHMESQGLNTFLRNIFSFPSKVLNSTNKIITFPSFPLKDGVSNNYVSFVHFCNTIVSIFLSFITTRFLKYDVIVATDPMSVLVALLTKKSKSFVVYEDLDYFEDLQTGKLQKKFVSFSERFGLKRADLIVSVSEPLVKRARQLNSDCILVPNGTNLDCFPESKNSKREPFIIYAGSLDKWAGLDLVIEAFSKLKIKIPSIELKIVGDGKERFALQELVNSLFLQDSIHFLGKLPFNQVAFLLSHSYLGLAMFKPGNAAAFASPLKLFDYMAAGVPIVATDIGDIGRIVRSSNSGIVVNWDSDEFVEAVFELFSRKKLWLCCHESGLQYVKRYDWKTLFNYWFQQIQNIFC